MVWRFFTGAPFLPVEVALTWLTQSTVLLVLGLLAGRLLRKTGPAAQSSVYRTTLAAVLFCPIAAIVLAAAGWHGIIIRLPSEAPGQTDRRQGEPSPRLFARRNRASDASGRSSFCSAL